VAPINDDTEQPQQLQAPSATTTTTTQPLNRNRSGASAAASSTASGSQHQLQNSPSHDSSHPRPPYGSNNSINNSRRKKPLAVAVGFHYAEDPKGRPIVITPTTNLGSNNNSNNPPSITTSPSVATAVTANTSSHNTSSFQMPPPPPLVYPAAISNTVVTGTCHAPIDLTHVGAVSATTTTAAVAAAPLPYPMMPQQLPRSPRRSSGAQSYSPLPASRRMVESSAATEAASGNGGNAPIYVEHSDTYNQQSTTTMMPFHNSMSL
jgi:hypothetical protein